MGSGVGVLIEAWKVAFIRFSIMCFAELFPRSRKPLTSASRPRPRVHGSLTAWTSKVMPSVIREVWYSRSCATR